MAVIAIDLGGTKALGAVFDASGKMCARQVKLLDGAKGDAVGDIVLDLIKALCGSCRGERVEAVGICVPGMGPEYSRLGKIPAQKKDLRSGRP